MQDPDSHSPRGNARHAAGGWLLVAFAGLVFGYALISTLPHEVADEGFHGPQVWTFFSGEFALLPNLTMPPTYHLLLAGMMRAFGFYDVDMLRLLSALVAALGLPLFHLLARRHWAEEEAGLRTLQWFFLPVFFPYVFLIYTDAWSMLPLLAMFLFALRGRHVMAALCGLLAVLFRQTAIAWVALACVLAALEGGIDPWRPVWRGLWRRALPYACVFAAFVVFVVWNQGVALGDRSLQSSRFHVTNLYFFLLCGWVFLLPWNLHQLPAIARQLQRPAVLLLLAGGLLVYLATFSNPHQYNQPSLDVYLRNRVLAVMVDSVAWRCVLYLPIAWMALTLLTTRWPERRLVWLLPAAALTLCLHPLIEVRYYLPALALLIAWRPPLRPGWEIAGLCLSLVVSAAFCFGIARLAFFL